MSRSAVVAMTLAMTLGTLAAACRRVEHGVDAPPIAGIQPVVQLIEQQLSLIHI